MKLGILIVGLITLLGPVQTRLEQNVKQEKEVVAQDFSGIYGIKSEKTGRITGTIQLSALTNNVRTYSVAFTMVSENGESVALYVGVGFLTNNNEMTVAIRNVLSDEKSMTAQRMVYNNKTQSFVGEYFSNGTISRETWVKMKGN